MPRYAIYISLVFLLSLLSIALAQTDTITYTVYESSPDNFFVGNVNIEGNKTLRDANAPSTLTFQILPSRDADYFMISADGTLRTSQEINRDILCPYLDNCYLKLDIAVKNDPDFFMTLKVQVDVQDLNNNDPEWPQSSISRSIPENTPIGSSFSIPVAEDPDSKKFSIKSYQLLEGAPVFDLKVRNISGNIDLYLVLEEPLDRERTDKYSVKVIAFDGGVPPNSGTLTVDISIQDNNDNRPKFEQDFYEVNIYENIPVTSSIAKVKANDPDAGDNGKVTYAFAQRTLDSFGDVFEIDSTTGEITLQTELDYEKTTTYNLFVTAQEMTPEFLPEEVRVIVNVADVNDHPPQITVNSLTTSGLVEVSETAPPGSFLAHITVDDPDTGYNGEFRCELESSGLPFSIDQKYDNEFTLKTAGRFDREVEDKYVVIFRCVDNGSPQLTGSAEITITILDENDNYPAFSDNLFTAELQENNPIGIVLMQFQATDLDAGPNGDILYTVHNSAEDFVHYDPESGNLTADVSFDYEQFQSVTFQITAYDQGVPPKSSSATILIKIRDINDEAPEFLMPKYVFGVYEGQAIGAEVGVVSAIDRDNEPNNEFIYSLKPSIESDKTFVIEPLSGRILTKRQLDRETEGNFDIIIIATDKHDPSLSSTVSVSVYIVDINDHRPVIDFPNSENNTVYISSQPSGLRLPRILAHDDDADQNAKLMYEIESADGDDTFIVDENTGQLYIQKDTLDKDSFMLDIIVRDQGDIPLLTRGTLVVIVNATGEDRDGGLSLGMISGDNLVIVIIVAIVSGVITLVLVVAIVILKRQDVRARRKSMLRALFTNQGAEQSKNGSGGDNADAESRRSGSPDGDGKKEVSFSQDLVQMENAENHRKGYDGVDWQAQKLAAHSQASSLDDGGVYKQQQTGKPAQTKADKQWQVQQYLSHIPENDNDSVHSNADSGMGSNEEHHHPPSPDKDRTGKLSGHPPVPPRAPILRHPQQPRTSSSSSSSPVPTHYPRGGRDVGGARSVTPSGFFTSSDNLHRQQHLQAPKRSNSLQGGRDNPAYNHSHNDPMHHSNYHNDPHIRLEDSAFSRQASVV